VARRPPSGRAGVTTVTAVINPPSLPCGLCRSRPSGEPPDRSTAGAPAQGLATESGVRFSLATFTLVGIGLLPVQLAAAYIGLRLTGAIA